MKLYDLKVNNIDSPLGLSEVHYFSWKIESAEQEVEQTAYHILLHGKNGNIVWDSGKVNTDASCFVEYQGKKIDFQEEYEWTVTVWDNKNQTASETSSFETALQPKTPWMAKWIVSPFIVNERKNLPGEQPPATMFRTKFSVDEKKVTKARLYASCHGIYRPYINGKRIDGREFAPENTTYPSYLCYQVYDVSALLNQNENVLELYVGDGWYCCPNYRREGVEEEPVHAALYQLEIWYEDGSKSMVCSNETAEAAQGYVRYSDIFHGEKYDANEEFKEWKSVVLEEYGYENLVAQPEAPVVAVKVLSAKEIFRTPKGELVADFGQVISGRVKVRLQARKGTEVYFDHYEVLDENGNCFDNLNMLKDNEEGICQRDILVLSDRALEYEPLFTFHGFRYVRIIGIDSIEKEDIVAVALSTEKKETGTFCCSDTMINRLYENTRWSQRANMMSIPTDCPQREKAGWTGDITVYAKTSLLNEDTSGLLSRWLKNLAIEQDQFGAVPFVVPYAGHYPGLAKSFGKLFGNKGDALVASSGWGDAAVVVPYMIYQITGNTNVLKEQYSSMKSWCNYMVREAATRKGSMVSRKETDQYLWNTGFHWGEWLIPSLSKNGFDINTIIGIVKTRKYIAPSYAYQSIRMMAEVAARLGMEQDADYYHGVAENIRAAFAKTLITSKGKMRVKFMGAYVIALAFDLVPEVHRLSFVDELCKRIEENDYCLDTGFLATPFLLPVLCKYEKVEMAYKLLYQTKCPSWLFEVEKGATTIWESWYGYSKEGKPLAISMNHYSFGCVDEWMFETINGIKQTKPGFKEFLIRPQIDEKMQWANRSFESSYGKIVSNWKKDEDCFFLQVEIPCNTKAKIMLPDGQCFEKGSGSYTFSCKI